MQNNDLKTDIVSMTGHELRTAISGNKWALKMLLDKDLGELNNEQEQLIKHSYEKNEKMLELINQLLLLKESDENKNDNKNEKIIIPELVKDIIEDFRSEAYKRKVEIIFLEPDQISTEKMNLNFSPKIFRIIFQNILSNSLKYNKEGGSIFISVFSIENGIKISIRDTGIGIPKGEQKDIFNKFYRASNARVISEDGSGLGLYIISSIIHENGGIIELESKEGVGSTFTFTLYNNI